MSRIGNAPIEVPDGVTVTIEPARVAVAGPLGTLQQQVPARMKIEQADGVVTVTRPTERGEDRALHGLTRTLVANMVEGVTQGFEKKLEIQGVGYRAALQGTDLELIVGYSHPVKIKPRTRHHVRGADADARSSSREPTSRWSARRPPRSARCARRSRTRARASATRASTCAARSEAGIARTRPRRRVGAATAACAARSAARAERPRLAVFRSNRGIYAQLVDDARGKTLAVGVGLGLAEVASRATRPSRRGGRQGARSGGEEGRCRDLSSSTAAATCTTDASRRSQTARAKED